VDLQLAVAASMLPASRVAVAAAFKDLRHESVTGAPFLELLWDACGGHNVLGAGAIADLFASASVALAEAERLQVQPVRIGDPRYPPLLECTPHPPPVLWLRGDATTLGQPAVAIVGSRAATPYALQVASRLGEDVARHGLVVVSGLARGVDSAAHRGALEAGGRTAAVLGCGPDRVYPPEHDELARGIEAHGVLLSELAPGAPPLPEHFPLRNRLISGISLGTVVVEASERSGSLITARWALDQGRDVMVVPGSVLSGRNAGSHRLLKDGARVVESADDILDGLGWNSRTRSGVPARLPVSDPLLAHMPPGEPCGLDELAASTGIDGPRLLARLTELEVAGLVASAGGRFLRRG
jgi:DNA processing protein